MEEKQSFNNCSTIAQPSLNNEESCSSPRKILITGANSYVGTSFEKWLGQWPDKYHVDTIDMVDGTWREKSFSGYDVVFHVAGIAHVKETKSNKDLYYKINRDLAVEVAHKARHSGVRLFIFMSSMSVYGVETGLITRDTPPDPKSNYAKAKYEAELLISTLTDPIFKVAILRPPMIYGSGCKGNYARLEKFAKITPIFPEIKNQRSMIYIDVLAKFIKNIVDNDLYGLFLPQNDDYVCTSELVRDIAKKYHKHIYFTQIFNYIIKVLIIKVHFFSKVFGDLIYIEDQN